MDDSFLIRWVDKGNAMPLLPDTVHYLIWNELSGQNEIQYKDASTGNMTGNTDLTATSDAVGSTTIADLLTWGETRKGEIETAYAAYDAAVADDIANETTNAAGKTWVDYDPNYS
tara:strand:+ start:119 stop:463 length:345 start_codon:yes stop_codon:yes gene_type:complete